MWIVWAIGSSPLLSIEMLTFVGCEGLNTLPVSPGNTPRDSSYNKYNSLDRRRLSKLSPALLQPRDQPGSGGFMRLSAYVPNSEPKLRPYRWDTVQFSTVQYNRVEYTTVYYSTGQVRYVRMSITDRENITLSPWQDTPILQQNQK